MDVERGELYAVVSGDIVDSTKLDPIERESLFTTMRKGSDVVQEWLGPRMPLGVDIFSGDSWQMLVTDPGKSLAAALLYRAYLRSCALGMDTRLAVGIGTIDFVPRDHTSEGDGEAFRLSGRLLSEHRHKSRMRFASLDQEASFRWDLVFQLIDSIVVLNWTEKRSLAITGALRHWTQNKIRELWDPPISQPTVKDHLDEAGQASIKRAITDFEEYWASYDRK